MDLRSALPYRVVTAQNQLRVDLGGAAEGTAAAPAPAATVTPVAPAVPSSPKAAGKVTRVEVQSVRGRQQIAIRTSGPVTYAVAENADPLGLAVDVGGAVIEPAAVRTVDLAQVNSPISRLRASQYQIDPATVRVVADLRGPTRYDVRQTPTAIVVDFLNPTRPVGAAPRAARSDARCGSDGSSGRACRTRGRARNGLPGPGTRAGYAGHRQVVDGFQGCGYQ